MWNHLLRLHYFVDDRTPRARSLGMGGRADRPTIVALARLHATWVLQPVWARQPQS
jgi:hypothetical protein